MCLATMIYEKNRPGGCFGVACDRTFRENVFAVKKEVKANEEAVDVFRKER